MAFTDLLSVLQHVIDAYVVNIHANQEQVLQNIPQFKKLEVFPSLLAYFTVIRDICDKYTTNSKWTSADVSQTLSSYKQCTIRVKKL